MGVRRSDGFGQFMLNYSDGLAPQGTTITCGRCSEAQPPSEFYIARAIRHRERGIRVGIGVSAICRRCNASAATVYRSERVALIDAAHVPGCVDCGLVYPEHPEVFDFDHVRGEKIRGVSAFLTQGTVADLIAEIAKCDVVCANCHRIRTRSRGAVTRGRDGRKASWAVGRQRV